MSYHEAAPWMESFQVKNPDPFALKIRSSRQRDLPAKRLARCMDLFDAIEAWHPEGALRDEFVRACQMFTGVERERCLGILLAKIERKIGEALA